MNEHETAQLGLKLTLMGASLRVSPGNTDAARKSFYNMCRGAGFNDGQGKLKKFFDRVLEEASEGKVN